MIDFVSSLLRHNDLEHGHYAEPYAGGCGLALSLLYGGHVSEIHINDIDPAVWAFWYCVLSDTQALADLILNTPVTIDEWIKQRDIYREHSSDFLRLGFSAFFLNRTNRSGIIKGAGVIGGIKQNGNFKMDCRYNKDDLIRRVFRVKKYADRIHLSCLDAQDFMKKVNTRLPRKSLLFIDPPYFKKGADLYTSYYKPNDHAQIAKTVERISLPWIVTYDDVQEIRDVYLRNQQYAFDISYSVREKRLGSELLITSNKIRLPMGHLKHFVEQHVSP